MLGANVAEPWTDTQIREGFIDDSGLSEYHDPINGARDQRRIAGAIFDEWLREHDRRLSRKVWFEGASSRQCHCSAYSEGECACGMYPSEVNPYLVQASASAGDQK
jgi:hypothetical protein